jgi:hypothetical protein
MSIKKNRAVKLYTGFKGSQTLSHIESFIPGVLYSRLTGSELSLVMTAVNDAFNAGKSSTGADVIDPSKCDGAVWVNCLNALIEWREEGAEYETVTEFDHNIFANCMVTRSKKIKDGQLIATIKNFANEI